MLILPPPVVSWEIFQFLGNLKCLETSRHKLCKQTSPLERATTIFRKSCLFYSFSSRACVLNMMIVDIFLTILAHIIIWFLWWNCPATGYAKFTVNLLYINHTCKITNLILRHLAKLFFCFIGKLESETTYLPQLSIVYYFEAYKIIYWNFRKWKHVTTTFHCPCCEAYKISFCSIDTLESENMWLQLSIVIINHWSITV